MPFHVNDHYLKLKAGYLFPEIGRRVKAYAEAHPEAKVIRLGIGDVTEPLPEAVIIGMHKAVDDMARRETFHGYGPEQGYGWLREKIAQFDFRARGCHVDADEVFVSDGSKCDTGNVLDILDSNQNRGSYPIENRGGKHTRGNTIAVPDPVYPVYVDTNVMAGNTGPANERGEFEGLVYLPMTPVNKFTPDLPKTKNPVDVIYLCFPNNPTGAVISKQALQTWVDYARKHGSLILFDAAYEAYITDSSIPHSIYECEGARECAIEFRSFSKTAGFTGTRCAFTVVPKDLKGRAGNGDVVDLHRLWTRRHTTKFNGVSYIVQRGAEAVYSEAGQEQVKALVKFYLDNARIIRDNLTQAGFQVYGGENAPYVWVKTPDGLGSWEFFDKLLNEAHVVGTPGAGFGACGEGFFRISAFNSRENVEEAMERITAKLAV